MSIAAIHIGAYAANPKVVVKTDEVCYFFRVDDVLKIDRKDGERILFSMKDNYAFHIEYSFDLLVKIFSKLGFCTHLQNEQICNDRLNCSKGKSKTLQLSSNKTIAIAS